jgi:hypothetical protein
MPLKPSVLELLRRTHEEEQALVEELSEAAREESSTLEHWSAKDLIAHITAWKERQARRMEAAVSGETPPSFDDVGQENAQIFEQYRLVSLSEVEQEADRISAELIAVVGRFPEEELIDPQRYAWTNGRPLVASVLGNGVWHPYTHLTEFYRERGAPQRAVQIQEALTDAVRRMDLPAAMRANAEYNLACVYATTGEPDKALALLPEALGLDPALLEWAQHDPDLASLHANPAFQALFPR